MKNPFSILLLTLLGLSFLGEACKKNSPTKTIVAAPPTPQVLEPPEPPLAKIPVSKSIRVSDFFDFLDEIVLINDSLPYKLTENLLLRANPWLLDSLVNTDYYLQMTQGNFVYDQRKIVLLRQGDTLLIPGPKMAAVLLEKMAKTHLEINIPAFEMDIMEGDSVLFRIPVRVGKAQKKHLEMAGGIVDLRTRTGSGEITRVNRNPSFYDPVTGKKFNFTKRDDHKTTVMPQIPWIEPTINGQRYGQLIHPTTNPRTLGKAASNGCIGTGEGDAWRVYFFAPIGTKVRIRYELEEVTPQNDTLRYEDVYQLRQKSKKAAVGLDIAKFFPEKHLQICVCDSLF